jgi:anaerobic magnesium-protoporphyrin IX monomethyl ester cyclase
MDTLLIHPHLRESYAHMPPLGLGYIASCAQVKGHHVALLDLNVEPDPRQALQNALEASRPEVVGISCVTSTFNTAMGIARSVKQQNPESVIILGGSHVTFLPEEILRENPFVDFVLQYEADQTFSQVLEMIETELPRIESIEGLCYRSEGIIILNGGCPLPANIDDIPFPDRALFALEKYPPHYRGTLITSRGCPFQCPFCSSSKMHGKVYRRRSPKNILAELTYVVNAVDTSIIHFVDDNIAFDQKRLFKMCDRIIQENIGISWNCNARIDNMSWELLQKMAEAGCSSIIYGLESGSQHILDGVKKGYTVGQAEEIISLTKRAGIRPCVSFIIGLPRETTTTLVQTYHFIDHVSPYYYYQSFLVPLPGTDFFSNPQEWEMTLRNLSWDFYHGNSPIPLIDMKNCDMNHPSVREAETRAFLKTFGDWIPRKMEGISEEKKVDKIFIQGMKGVVTIKSNEMEVWDSVDGKTSIRGICSASHIKNQEHWSASLLLKMRKSNLIMLCEPKKTAVR